MTDIQQQPDWKPDTAVPGPTPNFRRLRVFATDPKASGDLETAAINETVIALPWDQPWQRPLTVGPCGEYLAVIDHDPASGLFYAPFNPNEPAVLADQGLAPSESNPQFHQQMVFAVAMKTIHSFERALGRSLYWCQEGAKAIDSDGDDVTESRFAETRLQLHIYPHALREQNAYYSPDKCAVLFGYFQPDETQRGDKWVFTCLSSDIIAHETTHAILHGIDRRSIEDSNPDVLAFHEGFADIVALLQHFQMRDVLEHQIALQRGDLRKSSLLTGLAGQFGTAIGREGGALRQALKLLEKDHPAPQLTDAVTEPHDRGGYLVAAVFDALVLIYERRVADLMRIALGTSQPTGQDLSSDLVARLAGEASKAADHVLRMCIRALDYVPPVDVTFGEYLRAIITADTDLVKDDRFGYRVAFAQAFRHRGIFGDSVSMTPASLCWDSPDWFELPTAFATGSDRRNTLFKSLLPYLQVSFDYGGRTRLKRASLVRDTTDAAPVDFFAVESLRHKNLRTIEDNRWAAWDWLMASTTPQEDALWERLLGLEMLTESSSARVRPGEKPRPPLHSVTWRHYGSQLQPVFSIDSVRVARRSGPDGEALDQLVIRVVQRRRGYLDPAAQASADAGEMTGKPDFWFRGGATLLVDLRDGQLRYVIRKSIHNEARLNAHRQHVGGGPDALDDSTYGRPHHPADGSREPFAIIHRS